MSGLFGVVSKKDCIVDVFFGTDYHSHLGTRRAGIAMFDGERFDRSIHNIENTPFRTKFDKDVKEMKGVMGIGCISDYEPQPLIIRSHHGTFAITTISKINNKDELIDEIYKEGNVHFLEMSGGEINSTELVATLINQKENIIDGIRYALDKVDGSLTLMVMTTKGIYVARDNYGRTPMLIGKKSEENGDSYCASFEDFAYQKLEYKNYKELLPGEIDIITTEGVTVLSNPEKQMKVCTFLWVYYGYPSSSYEGVNED